MIRDGARSMHRVVKLGGSLLNIADWPQRFLDWHGEQPPAATVLIVGGGKLADCVRAYDRRFELGEEAAHWLCVRALGLHAEMAATLLARCADGVSLVRRLAQLGTISAGAIAVLDPEPLLRDDEPQFPGEPLPHRWEATTDSIAARIAECLDANELVLLKSAPPPDEPTRGQIGYVDGHFEIAARGLRCVRFVDFRAAADSSRTRASASSNAAGKALRDR